MAGIFARWSFHVRSPIPAELAERRTMTFRRSPTVDELFRVIDASGPYVEVIHPPPADSQGRWPDLIPDYFVEDEHGIVTFIAGDGLFRATLDRIGVSRRQWEELSASNRRALREAITGLRTIEHALLRLVGHSTAPVTALNLPERSTTRRAAIALVEKFLKLTKHERGRERGLTKLSRRGRRFNRAREAYDKLRKHLASVKKAGKKGRAFHDHHWIEAQVEKINLLLEEWGFNASASNEDVRSLQFTEPGVIAAKLVGALDLGVTPATVRYKRPRIAAPQLDEISREKP